VRYCILILLISPACTATRSLPIPDPELAVVLKALEDEVATAPGDSVLLFHQLVAQTGQAADFESWLEALVPEQFRPGMPRDLLRRYWQTSRTSRRLGRIGLIAGRPVRLVHHLPTAETRGMFSSSRVGFAPTGDSAVLTLTFACPGLCGSSDLWLYIRGPSGWERRRLLHSLVN
jgi:hypothetical protein